jgi:hypothetical protein
MPHRPRPKRQEIDDALAQLEQAFATLLPADYQDPPGPKVLGHWLNHLFW